MCPICVGSALLFLTGASSAGGLTVIASRALGRGPSGVQAHPPAQSATQQHDRIGTAMPKRA
jgi:hypothetical protein